MRKITAWMLQAVSAPTEIRTLVLALKGPRPSPLDDGGKRADCIMRGEKGSSEILLRVGAQLVLSEAEGCLRDRRG